MTKQVTAAEANRNFSGLLRDVATGDTIVVTSHGRPVAKITAFDEGGATFETEARSQAVKRLWERLAKQPALNLGKMSRDEIYDFLLK